MTMKAKLRLVPMVLGVLAAVHAVSCGGSSKSTKSTAGTGGSGNTLELGTCDSPMPVGATGWIQCDTGILHRESAGSCPLPTPMTLTCGDCFGAPNPWCLATGFGTAECVQGCATDADCSGGAVCFCQGDWPGRCIAATCTTDADCGDGSLCATYEGPPSPSCSYVVSGLACQTQADRCVGNECNCVLKDDRRECVQGLGGCGPG